MAIYVGSRYEFDPVYAVECDDGDGHSHLTIYSNTDNGNRADVNQTYRLHVCVEGDRLDTIAFKYYGNAEKWWYIADANPDQLFDPTAITAGLLLRIPSAP